MEAPPEGTVITRRELIIAAAICIAVSIAMTWPLLLHLTDKVAENDVGDPLLQAWEIAWGGHSLTNEISSYWDGNAFWPLNDGLAFSDALTGYAPLAMLGAGAETAMLRYNILFLFAYSLSGFGAYLLARELRVGIGPAAIAGAIYAWAPWRLTHNGHLNIISSGGIPLSLFLLVRGYRNDSPKLIVAGWAVATWQVSLGFNLGLSFGYLLAVVALASLIQKLRKKNLFNQKGVLAATATGVAIFLGWTAFQAAPYLRVVENHPESRRQIEEVTFYSPPITGFITAPAQSKLWGAITEERRAALNWPSEQALWPGGLAIVLAAVGLTYPGYSWKLRVSLLIAILGAGLVAMGFRFEEGAVYRYVYEYLPGFQGLRTPGRLINLITLGLALLAAGGAAALLSGVGRGKPPMASKRVIAAVLTAVVLAEGVGTITYWDVPQPSAAIATAEGPQLHLPSDWLIDPTYMFFSIEGWPRIANGHSGFVPTAITELRARTASFPDEASLAYLRDKGIRTVIFHRNLAPGTPWADVESRPMDPRVGKEDHGSVVIFDIPPL